MLPALLVKERKNKKMAATGRTSYSIVEYFGENDGYRCGYCKSTSTNFSHGMWADSLTVQDYQYLMDRGWRRSGQYIYKPTMHLTCCPMYTIRCFALDFKLTKSQKKIIKRVNRFLASGERRSEKDDNTSQSSDMEIDDIAGIREEVCKNKPKADNASKRAIIDTSFLSSGSAHSGDSSSLTAKEVVTATSEALASGENISESTVSVEATTNLSSYSSECVKSQSSIGSDNPSVSNKSASKPGVGADASKPACKKAKLLRLERKKQKLLSKGLNNDEVASKLNEKTAPAEKTVEDFINEPLPTNPAHRLEIRLVNSNPSNKEFQETFETEYEIYKKYQMAIHGDPPTKCSKRQYTRFLVNSPLQIVLVACGSPSMRLNLGASWALYVKYQTRIHKETPDECSYSTYLDFLVRTPLELEKSGPPSGYGSFHQQYWLDNQLIAVGVIDILPSCISSVYFYYDPDYSDLSLGTYASLRETAFTRSLHYHDPGIKYYYMGFYIDSCPKMRYKGRLKPSYLLCPETYTWHPIEDALVKLKKSKYSRLNDDVSASDPEGCVNVNAVLVLFHNVCMDFRTYRSKKRRVDDDDEEDLVKQYASLVGMKCAKRLLLVRS